jgi:Ca2+-binding EF-hand superfamily protein|eukprot:COSAG03_NODE_3036_length_2272_cov_2.001840_2_plen_83_part_00
MMSRKPDALRHPAEILAAFKLFEKSIDESPGYVRHSALIHGLTNLADEKLSRSEATELLSQLPEPDERGFINYLDYISMMAQ